MKKVFEYLKPYYLKMLFGFIIKFAGTLMDLCIPWVLAHIIDNIIPLNSIALILVWGGAMFIFSIGALTLNITANRMASKVARDTTQTIRHDLFDKISHLSSAQVDSFTVSSLISRMTSDTYNIHNMIGMMQRLGVRAPILLIGGIFVTLTLDPVLALILIILLPILALVIVFIYKKGFPLFTAQQACVDNLVRTVRENITGIRVIKALSKTDYEKEMFANINSEVVQKEKKAGMTMAGLNPIVNLLLNIGLVFVIIVGAYRVNEGTSEVGKIIAFLTYFTIMLQSIMAISRLFITFSKSGASAARITAVIDADIDLLVEDIAPVQSDFHIEFNQVSFSYNKQENNVSNINFKIKKGESLGIIGSTGSGKTTLINLLMRFYDVDSGEILIDGRNIKNMSETQLRKKIGVVFQNDVLFADSIYENIDFGRHLDKLHIHSAAKDAQACEFIESLNDDYQSMLDIRGSNLSGGQKQRVLIARALAANPEILILDDSSSALDYKTDAQLRRALDEHFSFSTKIIIAQRISSIMNLDHIIVLEEGKIVGYGTHEQLLKSCDIYTEISKSQMGGE